MPPFSQVTVNRFGYRLCRIGNIIDESLPALWVAEGRGEMVDDGEQKVFSQARLIRRVEAWTPRTQRELACDFAEHVLHLFEDEYPEDDRPRKLIEVSRRFARGEATDDELEEAQKDVWSSAWFCQPSFGAAACAAQSAANVVERVDSWTACLIARAGKSASRAAELIAGDIGSVVGKDARSAELSWQDQRLIEVLGLDPD